MKNKFTCMRSSVTRNGQLECNNGVDDTIYDFCIKEKCTNYNSCSACENYFNFHSKCNQKCDNYKNHPDYTLNKDPRVHDDITQDMMNKYVKKIME